MNFPEKMSGRTKKLYDQLIEKAQGDRSGEWFTQIGRASCRERV